MPEPDTRITSDGRDIFIEVDGVRIAKRGHANTPEAKTWVSLVPGWIVTSNDDHSEIEVYHNGTLLH